jgi:phosphoglycerate dehydrogenase-like enzyme
MMALAKKICLIHKRLTMESLHEIGFPARLYDTTQSPGSNWARVSGLRTLEGATIGLLGLGEIGREMARRANAFGMRVLYTQRNRLPEDIESPLGALYVSLDELLPASDFISVHLPMNKSTENMLDAAAFARMKPGAMLINISRARIVNQDALMAALESGRLGGVAMDVHYQEPGSDDDPMLAFPNVVLTPHTAVATRRLGALDMEEMVGNLASVLG